MIGVAVTRPQNLVKFVEFHTPIKDQTYGQKRETLAQKGSQHEARITPNIEEFRKKFMMQLSNWFWQLLASRPINSVVAPVGQHLLTHIEATVQALIEIFHAFTTTIDVVDITSRDVNGSISFAAQIYAQFLMAENKQVSFAAKQALVRVLRPKTSRRKQLQSMPNSSSEQEAASAVSKESLAQQSISATSRIPPSVRGHVNYTGQPIHEQHHALFAPQEQGHRQAHHAPALGLGPGGIGLGGIAGNLAALLPDLAGAGGVNIPPPVLDMPAEVDDEAMVELAIALSLQEQNPEDGGAGAEIAQLQQGLQGLQQGLQQLANLGGQAFDGYPGLQGLAGILGEAGVVGLPPDVAEEEEIMFNQVCKKQTCAKFTKHLQTSCPSPC